MKNNTSLILLDVETVQDDTTGTRKFNIQNWYRITGEIGTVGVNAFWYAQAQHISLTLTAQIRARMYRNQHFIYLNKNLYEIKSTSSGSIPEMIKLNLSNCNNKQLLEEVQHVLGNV